MPEAAGEHGTVMPSTGRIGKEAWAMTSASVVLIVLGIVCLFLSGLMMYKLTPREGRPSPWTKTDLRETSAALTQFILLIAGVALLVKGVF
jgi:NO-binding membrane sensor protein with MHYT domain